MLEPVFIRDAFTSRKWYAYIPADSTGTYWWRTDFSVPSNAGANYFATQQMMLGIVRPGKVFYPSMSSGWIEGNTGGGGGGFYPDYGNLPGWSYRRTDTINDYIDVVIPAGYNIVQVLYYQVAGQASLGFSWASQDGSSDLGTAGLEVTSFAPNGTDLAIITVASNAGAIADGMRRFRVKNIGNAGNGNGCRIVGMRAFDSTHVGDPSTAVSGKAVGHDLITAVDPNLVGVSVGLIHGEPGIIDRNVKKIEAYGAATEFAIAWGPHGGSTRFTGGTAHFYNDGYSYPYTYHSGEYTNGPAVYVDVVAQYNVWDDAHNPKNTLLKGKSIVLNSTGFADWNLNGIETASEPDISWMYDITAAGLGINIGVMFNASTDIALNSSYGLMWGCPTNQSTGYLSGSPGNEHYDLSADRHMPGNCCELCLDGIDAVMRIQAAAAVREMWFLSTTKKLYTALETAACVGGTNPQTGAIWAIGGRFEVQKKNSVGRARTMNAGRLQIMR